MRKLTQSGRLLTKTNYKSTCWKTQELFHQFWFNENHRAWFILIFKWFQILYYYHFVGHCGAFCGLKQRFWRAKMYSSPHARLHGCSDCLYACCPFFSRNSLNALQTDNNSVLFIQFMFAGISMFQTLLRIMLILAQRLRLK